MRTGWGLERNRNGGSAVAATLAMPAVAGKFGVRGGGYTMSNSGVWNVDVAAAAGLSLESLAAPAPAENSDSLEAPETPETLEAPEPPEAPEQGERRRRPRPRTINMNRLGEVLLGAEPPVQVLFVYNCNPLATMPEQERVRRGLEREDLFTVVFDQVMTDTARYADIVLPATTFLEGYDLLRAYGPWRLSLGRPVIEPVGESRCNADVFGDLIELTELHEDGDARGELEEMLNVLAHLPGTTGDDVRDCGTAVPPFDGRPIQFKDVFPRTLDQKVDLYPDALAAEAAAGLYVYQPDPATPEFPLTLISPASDKTISSTLGEIPRPEVRLLMHPDDAAERGIGEGDDVRIFNALGEVRCKVNIGGWIRRGIVSLPKGIWRKHTANGYTGTVLVPDTLTDLGGGACFNDARVQVSKTVQGRVYRPSRHDPQ
jgi:anaerobic selenocysteine-containing dehydrogenase